MSLALETTRPETGPVMTKAMLRAAERLGVSARELARIVGVSEAGISRMRKGALALDPGTKPFELGTLFVRLFRSLDAVTGGDENVARAWLRNENTALDAVPAQAIETVSGLFRVIDYLDSRRAVI